MGFKKSVLSNLAFLIPLFLSILVGNFFHSLFIFAVFLSSVIYHIKDNPRILPFDKLCAFLLISYNFYVCYLTGFREPYFILILISIAAAFYFLLTMKNKKGHNLWHTFSAIITTFCILSYMF